MSPGWKRNRLATAPGCSSSLSPSSLPVPEAILSIIFARALNGRFTASCASSPVRWKNRCVFAAKLAGNDVRARAGSSPSAVLLKGAVTGDAKADDFPRGRSVGDPGGSSAIAAATFRSNSSGVILLKPDASIVSMKEIAPVYESRVSTPALNHFHLLSLTKLER